MSAPTNVPPSSAVTVVQSIFEPVTGFKPIQITVPQYGPVNLVGVLILTQNIRAFFLIQVATTSPSGSKLFHKIRAGVLGFTSDQVKHLL